MDTDTIFTDHVACAANVMVLAPAPRIVPGRYADEIDSSDCKLISRFDFGDCREAKVFDVSHCTLGDKEMGAFVERRQRPAVQVVDVCMRNQHRIGLPKRGASTSAKWIDQDALTIYLDAGSRVTYPRDFYSLRGSSAFHTRSIPRSLRTVGSLQPVESLLSSQAEPGWLFA